MPTFQRVVQRRFTVEEYHRMAETGILGPDERVELIRGLINTKVRKSREHVIATAFTYGLIDKALRGTASVYQGAPLTVERLDSEPEPDLLICSNPDPLAYGTSQTKPLLIIEVADSSLEYDVFEKAAVYAEAGVPEYWVLNLVARALVIFRKPLNRAYLESFSLDETARVTPEAWPEMVLRRIRLPSAGEAQVRRSLLGLRPLPELELDIDYRLGDVTGRRTSGTVRLNSFEARRDFRLGHELTVPGNRDFHPSSGGAWGRTRARGTPVRRPEARIRSRRPEPRPRRRS